MTDLVKSIFLPSHFIMIVLITGIILTFLGRLKRLRNALLLVGVTFFVLFSTGPVAALLLSPLEYRFPAMVDIEQYPEAETIIILAGYAAADERIPLSSQANGSSMFRLIEALHLYVARPSCEIIISGVERDVRLLAEQLSRLGVPSDKIVMESSSAHSYQSSLSLADKLGRRTFFLVTSAGHMPRAMGVFRALGLRPIPAPTDYKMPKDFRTASVWPSAKHLWLSDQAVREYGGIIAYRLMGRINTVADSGF